MTLQVIPVRGLPEVAAGDDLAALIAAAADLRPGDVVVVSQKVVSKAEGALVALAPGEDVDAARRRVAREQAVRIVADAPWVLVVQTATGLVCANAGVDASNVPPGCLALLPVDPDASARRLRAGLRAAAGVDVAVVVADTFGRPWRLGQTDVAIGVAGLRPLRDERGATDRHGRALRVTQTAVADEVAAAADLVRRKADGVPAVVLRGLEAERAEDAAARDLVRPAERDLFHRGRGMLAASLTDPSWPAAWRGGVAPDDVARVAPLAAGLTVAEPGPPTVLVTGDRVGAGLVAAALDDLGYRARALRGGGTGRVEAGVPAATGGSAAATGR